MTVDRRPLPHFRDEKRANGFVRWPRTYQGLPTTRIFKGQRLAAFSLTESEQGCWGSSDIGEPVPAHNVQPRQDAIVGIETAPEQ